MRITLQSKFDEKRLGDQDFVKANNDFLLQHARKIIVEPITLVETKLVPSSEDTANKTTTIHLICEVQSDDIITLRVPVNQQFSDNEQSVDKLATATVDNYKKLLVERLSKIRTKLSNEVDKTMPDCKTVYVTCMVS